jgi:hypothetical protein
VQASSRASSPFVRADAAAGLCRRRARRQEHDRPQLQRRAREPEAVAAQIDFELRTGRAGDADHWQRESRSRRARVRAQPTSRADVQEIGAPVASIVDGWTNTAYSDKKSTRRRSQCSATVDFARAARAHEQRPAALFPTHAACSAAKPCVRAFYGASV